jgi:UDP-N-acetylmuramate dehydrogenase
VEDRRGVSEIKETEGAGLRRLTLSERRLREIFKQDLFKGEILFDQEMSAYTSLRIGGPVEIMVFPEDVVSLKRVLITAKNEKIPLFVFGAGTNLLVRDEGVDGIVVSLRAFNRIEVIQDVRQVAPYLSDGYESFTGLFVEAGVPLNKLINFTKKKGYSGLEPLTGIPGTFGGAVYMNAGSYGTEIKDVILSVALMKMDGSIEISKREEIGFSYRSSNIPEDTLILSANIILKKDIPENVSSRVNEFLKKKMQTQPIGKSSAGCVFKNPEGDYAARLIEASGCKGMRVGDIEVDTLHANYFINRGKATCSDFLELMEKVKNKVRDYCGITLEPEIRIIGRGDRDKYG